MRHDGSMKKWSFDKDFLASAIIEGKKQLASNNLSRRERKSIRCDVETFERFIVGDYRINGSGLYDISLPKEIDKLKDYILLRMAKQYKMLGEDFIRWIMDLSDEEIFEEDKYSSRATTRLSIEECAELTIKNYEKNLPKFLIPAKKIILDESVRQIQLVTRGDSYCYHDDITGQSYLLICPIGEPSLFNHEVEHAIEASLQYRINVLYYELGPIFLEMLFNEELYKLRGNLKRGDFGFRIDEIAVLLNSIYSYFQVMLLFAEKGFNVSTSEFISTFLTYKEINPAFLEKYLREEIANDEVVDDMSYLFSFLKAVELRERSMNSNNSQTEILEWYLRRKSFYFQLPKDGFDPYKRYVEEMGQRVRRKRRGR